MSPQGSNLPFRHKIRWYSAPYLIVKGLGVLCSLVLGLLVASSLATGLAIPLPLLAGLAVAIAITIVLQILGKRFIWIMDDRVFKGVQLGTSHIKTLGSIRFADVEEFSFRTDRDSAKTVSGHRFYFCNRSGWSKDLSFQVKDGQEAAVALEFFLLHIDRSAWEPDLDDWVHDWLRTQGKHLPHTT